MLYNEAIILYRKIIVEQRELFSFFYYHVRMAGLSAMLTLIVKKKINQIMEIYAISVTCFSLYVDSIREMKKIVFAVS